MIASSLAIASATCPAWADPPSTPPTSTAQTIWDGPTATGDWGGMRAKLDDQGISLGGSWVMESFDDMQGGAERGTVGASTLDANLTLDLQKLAGLQGGEFYADFEDHAGRDPDQLVGDLQTIDKLNWTAYFQTFEFWYQQKLFGDKLRIKIGKIDANSEFSVIDDGLNFLDASTQVTPTLLGFTTTPDPMPTVDVFYKPNSLFYADFSAADSNSADHFLDFSGHPAAIQPTANGKLLIGETGLTWKQIPGVATDGNLRLGVWEHTGTFTQFDGQTQHAAQGLYAIFNQTIWKPTSNSDDMRGIRTFLEYGQTDHTVSQIDWHYGGGVAWTGPIAARAQDVTGITAQYAHVSDDAGLPDHYELLLESFYKVQVNQWATLQPDLQYISHPGGRYNNALVGILTMQIKL